MKTINGHNPAFSQMETSENEAGFNFLERRIKMKKVCSVIFMNLFLLLSTALTVNAVIVTDPAGDNIGPVDLVAARAERYIRGDGVTLLKISLTSTPNLPGLVLFECNADNAGDDVNLTASFVPPVAPCPCKVASGIDVGIMLFTRSQGDTSQTAFCRGCVDQQQQACSKGRKAGEWYAYASAYGMENGLGVIRGFLDPLPGGHEGWSSDCYTLPWGYILQYAYEALAGDPRQFNLEQAQNPANNKWMMSIWHDSAFTDQDDFADGNTFLNISDWLPNGDLNLVNGMDMADNWTYCEGNFDNDIDVDGADASKFKTDFSRAKFTYPCPSCGPNY